MEPSFPAEFIDCMPDDKESFLDCVEKGIAAAERGDFIKEDEMDARVARMLQS